MSKARIVMTGHGRGEVFVDGQKIEDVTAVHFESGVWGKTPNKLSMTLIVERIEILAPVDVERNGA